jgi:hypothetical protein
LAERPDYKAGEQAALIHVVRLLRAEAERYTEEWAGLRIDTDRSVCLRALADLIEKGELPNA